MFFLLFSAVIFCTNSEDLENHLEAAWTAGLTSGGHALFFVHSFTDLNLAFIDSISDKARRALEAAFVFTAQPYPRINAFLIKDVANKRRRKRGVERKVCQMGQMFRWVCLITCSSMVLSCYMM